SEYLAAHSPLTQEKIPVGRIRSENPDLGLFADDIQLHALSERRANGSPRGILKVRIRARVRNLGKTDLSGASAKIELLGNENGLDETQPEAWKAASAPKLLATLKSGAEAWIEWEA